MGSAIIHKLPPQEKRKVIGYSRVQVALCGTEVDKKLLESGDMRVTCYGCLEIIVAGVEAKAAALRSRMAESGPSLQAESR